MNNCEQELYPQKQKCKEKSLASMEILPILKNPPEGGLQMRKSRGISHGVRGI